MSAGTDVGDVLLRLPGFRVTATTDDGAERLIGDDDSLGGYVGPHSYTCATLFTGAPASRRAQKTSVLWALRAIHGNLTA
jgi:hypothetical protein